MRSTATAAAPAAATAAAPDSDPIRPPTVRELLASRTQLSNQIAELEREVRSLTARNRALIRARNEMNPTMGVVGTFAKTTTVATIVAGARACEAMCVNPAVRFVRSEANQITGIELAALTERPETIDEGFRWLVAATGMSVVSG